MKKNDINLDMNDENICTLINLVDANINELDDSMIREINKEVGETTTKNILHFCNIDENKYNHIFL